jgi:hypothetical protein
VTLAVPFARVSAQGKGVRAYQHSIKAAQGGHRGEGNTPCVGGHARIRCNRRRSSLAPRVRPIICRVVTAGGVLNTDALGT